MLAYNTSMEKSNSFEYLVSTISQDERNALLKKLRSTEKTESQEMAVVVEAQATTDTIRELFIKESFFIKIFLYIKSFFISENIDIVYNASLLKNKARYIEKNYSNLIQYKERAFSTGLYHHIHELSLVAKYFKPYINSFEDNRSQFYINLSSIIVPDLLKRMDEEANPYNSSVKPEENIPRRNSYAKKVDEIINSITIHDKNTILMVIRSIEWLSAFCEIPFDKILSKFTADYQLEYSVPFENLSKELALLTKVLTTSVRFPLEMFEAFYLSGEKKYENSLSDLPEPTYSSHNHSTQTEIVSTDLNNHDGLKEFVSHSAEQIQLIKMFIQSVPVIEITRIAHTSILWKPDPLEKTETWLTQLKGYWKALFDKNWDKWLVSVKKTLLQEKMTTLIGKTEYPKLPYKPWAKINTLPLLQLEQSLEFLFAFYKQCYPIHMKAIKEVLLNGEFIQRDNKTEFTDTYNALDHIEKSIYKLNEKLSFKGNYGQAFTQIHQQAIITVQGQAKLKTLVNSLETEIHTLVSHFADSCRSISSLIGGILHEEKNPKYTTLKNIAEIWGNKNIDFRKQLQDARVAFIDALEIIKELDSLSLLETRTNN